MPTWLKQSFSFAVSLAVYTWLFHSWLVAILLIGAIAFHEAGHLFGAYLMGLKTRGVWFLPFIGGASIIAERYQRYSQMAFVVLAGPIAGTVLAVFFYLAYLITGSLFLGQATYLMAVLNVFNLIFAGPLDGGQLMETIAYTFGEVAGAIYLTLSYLVGSYVIWQFNFLIAIIVIMIGVPVVLTAWRRVRIIQQGMDWVLEPKPDSMRYNQIVITVCAYLLTASILLSLILLCRNHSLHIQDLFVNNYGR